MAAEIFSLSRGDRQMHEQLCTELVRLDTQEENLIDLVADGNLPSTKVRKRLGLIQRQRDSVQRRMSGTEMELAAGAALVEDGLRLLDDPQALYRKMDSGQRQLLNQATFEKLYVDISGVGEAVLNPPFDELLAAGSTAPRLEQVRSTFKARKRTPEGDLGQYASARTVTSVFFGGGSSKAHMVGTEVCEFMT